MSRNIDDLGSILERDTGDDLGQQVFALQPSLGLGGSHDELEHHQLGGGGRQGPPRPDSSVPDRGEDGLDRVRGPQVVSVLGGEVEEGEQRVTVPGQALGRLGVLRPILLDEDRDGCFGRRSRRRRGDLADVGLHGALHGFRHLVEQVGGLVQPAPLVTGGGQNLVERLLETEGAVAHRDLGRDGEAAPLHVDQQFPPALGAFPHADLKPDQFLPAFRRGSDENEHALGLVLHPGLQVDPVGLNVYVVPGRQIPLLPAIVFGLPFGREAPDHRGRQVRGVLAHQRRERLLEVAH